MGVYIGSRSWDGLAELARAWFGHAPWNAYADEDYLSQHLLKGVTRPSTVRMAGREELERLGVRRPDWD